MKKFLAVILSLLLVCSLAFANAENAENAEKTEEIPGTLDMPIAGMKFVPPEELRETEGCLVTDGVLAITSGIYYAYWFYSALPEDEMAAVLEDSEKLADAPLMELFYVFSIGNRMTFDTLNSLLTSPLPAEYIQEIGKAGETTFYLFMPPADEEYAKSVDEKYGEEYLKIVSLQDKIAEAFICYEPVAPLDALVGQRVSFTATDLEGNPVSSEEIFAQNEITMLNLWATWCGPCKMELPELQQISLRLQEKGCNVVGLLTDNNPEETQRLLAENGITYPVYYAPADIYNLFPVEGIPTTLFIGRDGTVLCKAVVGAQVDVYEGVLEDLLK